MINYVLFAKSFSTTEQRMSTEMPYYPKQGTKKRGRYVATITNGTFSHHLKGPTHFIRFILRLQELVVSHSETMRAISILLFACLVLAALADDNAAQLEKTDEDSSVSLYEVSDEVSGRSKREENPLSEH
ncbi:hypothetical protein LSAT2_010895 [Lamellibrachia satsuma]|nr:hypothetical protein LSAT2_010895 [Lamellibrachia satsuma]